MNNNNEQSSNILLYIPLIVGFLGMEYFLITSFPGLAGLGWALAYAVILASFIGCIFFVKKAKAIARRKIDNDLRIIAERRAQEEYRAEVKGIKSRSAEFSEITDGFTQ